MTTTKRQQPRRDPAETRRNLAAGLELGAKPRTGRPSKAVAAALAADVPTTQLPVLTPAPVRQTLDDLVAEVRPAVFRLLAAGKVRPAAELLATYADEADRALWGEVLDR